MTRFAPAAAPVIALLLAVPGCTPTDVDDDTPTPGEPLAASESDFTADAGDLVLEGTLLLPDRVDGEPVPGVVLVHGSGPHPRDAPLGGQLNMAFGFEIPVFEEIATHLQAAGYAVYRYDKRSCGDWGACDNDYPLPDDTLTAEAFVHDAAAAMDALGAHPDVDPARLAAVGHSQGGGFAPHVVDLAGGVGISVAGNWSAIDALLAYQADWSRTLLQAAGATPTDIDAALADLDQAILDLAELRAGTWGGGPIFGASALFWESWMALDDERPVLAATHANDLAAINGDYDWNVPPSELAGWRSAGVETVELPCVTHALNCVRQPDWTIITAADIGDAVDEDLLAALVELLAARL